MKRKIVVVGGGFAGLNVVKSLESDDQFEIKLIDKMNHHLFQPLLYQVATAALSPAQIAGTLREIFPQGKNIEVIMSEVLDIDKNDQWLLLDCGQKVFFDQLILSVGAKHSYFGHDEWEQYAPGLKTLSDALMIRETILLNFEKANQLKSSELNSMEALPYLRFVIIGAGPTGVEMAGALAEIAYQAMKNSFTHLKMDQVEIYLIEGTNRVLPSYPDDLSQRAQLDLEKFGVKVILEKKVIDINDQGVFFADQFLPCKNIIWAAGNQASPLLKKLNVPLDRQGRVVVEQDLTIPGSPHIFVIGDAACFIPKISAHEMKTENSSAQGQSIAPLPGIAPVAIQQGHYVGKILKKNLSPQQRKAFQYFDKGSLATIGKASAVGVIGPWHVKGFIAWFLWSVIHITYLVNFRNKILVMVEWIFYYLFNVRGVRLIYRSINQRNK